MPVSLTRSVVFSALHRFHIPSWTEQENMTAFGDLGAPPGHGHTYRCSATVNGALKANGTIMDLKDLDDILHQEVVETLDGQHLNQTVPDFDYGRQLPTCEALAAWLFPRLSERLPPGVRLERIRVAEDTSLHADCTGPTEADPAR